MDLIATPKARVALEERSRALGIRPHFVEVPAVVRRLTELAGGSWLRKLAWQKRVARVAIQLHAQQKFSVVHQTTFHTFRVPFLAAGIGVPSVWGPIAGGERVPPGFERYLGSARFSELGRNFVNRFWIQTPSVRPSLRRASVLFVSNHTTLDFLPEDCREKAKIVSPNALRAEDEQYVRPAREAAVGKSAAFTLLYVGNCVATRAMPIVFEALGQSRLTDYELLVVGGGPALEHWKQCAVKLGLGAKVRFEGKVPYARLNEYYTRADVLVFPALRDSGGSALLEAMARQVPVICLDWGGPGEMVDGQSGIKVPVPSPEKTVGAFASALQRLGDDAALRETLARAGRARAETHFRWQAKRELLEATYRRLLGQ